MAYTLTWLPMMAAFARSRAGLRHWLLSPLLAAPLTVAAQASVALLSPLSAGLGVAAGSLLQVGLGATITVALGFTGGALLARRAESSPESYLRGTRIVAAVPSQRPRQVAGATATLSLGGITVSAGDEGKHFKFIGTTGTGKSTAIKELMDGALRRGDRAVFADPDGGYLQRYFNAERGDVILNPFDARSMKWDLFGEITTHYDVDQLARSLIPDGSGSDRSWNNYARTFFSAVTRQAHDSGVRGMGELYRLLVAADARELRTLLQGTAAQPFLEENNSRMFDSIRSVASSAVSALEHVAAQNGAPFSIRQWVARENQDRKGGVLFMPYRAGQIAALRSTVSAWMRLAIFATMNGEECDRPLWFVVDELDALGQIDGLKDALARLRKFGGRCVLGFQSVGQVSNTYGTGEAQTIIENCGNTLILRCSASQQGGTASFASRLIGQRQILRNNHSFSRRPADWFASTTRAESVVIEPAVLDSELEQLADRQGFLKLSSMPQWQRVALTIAPAMQGTSTIAAHSRTDTAVEPRMSPSAQASAAARTAWQELRSAERVAAVRARVARPPRAARTRTVAQELPRGR